MEKLPCFHFCKQKRDLCNKNNCIKHHNYISNDSKYCPIILSSGKNKGKMCCNRLNGSNKKCGIHSKSLIKQHRLKNYTQCSYIFRISEYDNISSNLEDSNFKYINSRCSIKTKNPNGLCNFHNHHIPCPCNKHQIIESDMESNHIELHNLLFNNDIYENIIKHLYFSNMNIMRCVSKYHSNIKINNVKNQLISQNSKKEIIITIRELLTKCELDYDKSVKKQFAIEIFEYLSKNKKFIFDNGRFAITVYNKLYEFYYSNDLDKSTISKYVKELFNINIDNN